MGRQAPGVPRTIARHWHHMFRSWVTPMRSLVSIRDIYHDLRRGVRQFATSLVGDHEVEETPVPIPNTEVKLYLPMILLSGKVDYRRLIGPAGETRPGLLCFCDCHFLCVADREVPMRPPLAIGGGASEPSPSSDLSCWMVKGDSIPMEVVSGPGHRMRFVPGLFYRLVQLRF